jgi:hypothetical protein
MPALSSQFKFALGTGTMTATSVAIPSTSVSSQGTLIFKSEKEKGDGYFGNSDGFHTVSYTITPNFVGTLTTQATLATDPVEADWFDVADSTVTYSNLVDPVLTTTTQYVNFTGNFVWVRALVRRSLDLPNGSVQWINFNH